MVKNITLAVDEDVLERVRVAAAEEKTTVNAMVREFLTKKADQIAIQRERKAAAAKMLEMSRNSKATMHEGWKFEREGIYADRISGHQHHPLRGGGGSE